jgi:plastocyanin
VQQRWRRQPGHDRDPGYDRDRLDRLHGQRVRLQEANAVDLSGDEPFTVTIENFAYDPSCFKASAASTITIENKDSVTHTFSIDGTQVDATINGLETFNGESPGLAPGSYDFYCKLHPTMTGTLIVV